MSTLYLGEIELDKIPKEDIKTFTRKDGSQGSSIKVALNVLDSANSRGDSAFVTYGRGEEKRFLASFRKYDDIEQSRNVKVVEASPDDLPF